MLIAVFYRHLSYNYLILKQQCLSLCLDLSKFAGSWVLGGLSQLNEMGFWFWDLKGLSWDLKGLREQRGASYYRKTIKFLFFNYFISGGQKQRCRGFEPWTSGYPTEWYNLYTTMSNLTVCLIYYNINYCFVRFESKRDLIFSGQNIFTFFLCWDLCCVSCHWLYQNENKE